MTDREMINMMKRNNFNKWQEEHPEENMAEEFGKRIAKVMMELKSSHAYFIIQLACGEISWEEAEEILNKIIKNEKIDKIHYGIGVLLNNTYGMLAGPTLDIKSLLDCSGEINAYILQLKSDGQHIPLYRWNNLLWNWVKI